ncbi:hypothetical protein [Saccharibacillus sacchari]|uniref:hypothetical protein n=1 Tax=Saccharibacillus sacchari TaxID=456493 RepID=UPI0005617D88|nr:hypothetical protein [Saccharibacillus sacchari]
MNPNHNERQGMDKSHKESTAVGKKALGIGILIGTAFGMVLSILIENLAIGMPLGVALGVIFGTAAQKRKDKEISD